MKTKHWSEYLPGGVTVHRGLKDLEAERLTINACLASIAQSRLTANGIPPPSPMYQIREPERDLYRLLRAEGGDAYSRYNALIRELVSFENALERMSK